MPALLFSSVFHVSPEFVSSFAVCKLDFCKNYLSLSRAEFRPAHGLITLMSRHCLNPFVFAVHPEGFLARDVFCGTETFVK